jgi:hypothetical protein
MDGRRGTGRGIGRGMGMRRGRGRGRKRCTRTVWRRSHESECPTQQRSWNGKMNKELQKKNQENDLSVLCFVRQWENGGGLAIHHNHSFLINDIISTNMSWPRTHVSLVEQWSVALFSLTNYMCASTLVCETEPLHLTFLSSLCPKGKRVWRAQTWQALSQGHFA